MRLDSRIWAGVNTGSSIKNYSRILRIDSSIPVKSMIVGYRQLLGIVKAIFLLMRRSPAQKEDPFRFMRNK
jgi:hypothetical protein